MGVQSRVDADRIDVDIYVSIVNGIYKSAFFVPSIYQARISRWTLNAGCMQANTWMNASKSTAHIYTFIHLIHLYK